MIPSKRVRLQKCQSVQKRRAQNRYSALLRALLSEHSDKPYLSKLSEKFDNGDWDGVLLEAGSLSSQKYEDATSHYVANQFSLLIKKYPFWSNAVKADPRATAKRAFLTSEVRCKRINRKHELLDFDRSRDRWSKEIGAAKTWIRTVIGSRPNIRSISEKADFGPGASVGIHGDATSYAKKFASEKWSVTPGALNYAYAAFCANHHLIEALCPVGDGGMICYDGEKAFAEFLSRCVILDNNKISFVAKTAITDRTIAVEPLLNGFFQKGIDQVLRNKLKKVGIDLKDQGLNQEMARLGSLNDSDDGFVTIDLKSASDSVSIGVVRRLLPYDWFYLLDRTRSKSYELDGKVYPYHKFCSMGNGFCFPLETLIFASVCASLGCGEAGVDFMVYGDDIIVRKKYASKVIKFLGHLGFKTNSEKTFLEGPFRESCGKDWFAGQDVRPFTLDYRLDSLQACFKFLNLSRTTIRSESFFQKSRSVILDDIPSEFLFFRPFTGPPDTGIDSTGDEHLYSKHCVRRISKENSENWCWNWKEFVHVPRQDIQTLEHVRDKPWLISVALRGAMSVSNGRYKFLPEVTFRRRVETKVIRKGYMATSNWLPSV